MLRYIIIFTFFNYAISQKSYEGAQLLRLNGLKNSYIIDDLTQNFGGNIWKQTPNILDISFENHKLAALKDHIEDLGISYDVLIPNIQELINQSSSNIRKRATTMNWSNYYDYNDIIKFLYDMQTKYPNIATLFNIGSTFQNRKLLVLRISDNVAKNKAIWLDGGIHAREWIAPASMTYIINYLLTNWNSLTTKLKNKTWYIMPLVNPDGYQFSHTNDRLWRKNRKKFISATNCTGVDLNRNFNIGWNANSQSKDICSDTFRGLSAFSEKETIAVKTFLTNHKSLLKGMLTYHSYGQYIIWPWGYTYSGTAPNASSMKKVAVEAASNIRALTGKSYTTSRDTILGLISGATDDWTKHALNIPYTYTVELRDTGNHGFLLPKNQIIDTAKEALEVAKAVANAV